MEHYFYVSVWRIKTLYSGKRKTKTAYTGWFRSHDSSHVEWDRAVARVKELTDFLRDEAGDFVDEQAITARGGTYNWSWHNNKRDVIIEITKIDFGRVYDWDDMGPDANV